MTGSAVALLLLAIVLVWGGLIASVVFLVCRPEPTTWPPGGDDDERIDAGPIEHDT